MVQGLYKRFGQVVALDGVDLDVPDGTFCVLLGPSGCGKSTLLNVVAGLLPPDRGSVSMDGRPVDHLAPGERDVAMVFQNYALYPHMTVAGNLGFGLKMRGTSRKEIERRVLETARLLGLETLLDRKPRELSGGQRQRVAMGRALARRPRLFLMDEPLSNLDARLRAAVRLELRQLHRRLKGTIVYVTHDQVEAMTLGDRVVVMREGRVLQVGAPEDVYERPADTFVATFVGSPEMNLCRGRVVRGTAGFIFQGDGFIIDLARTGVEWTEGEVELGLRPEDLRIEGDDGLIIEVEIDLVSHAGAEKYVHGRLGRETITARLDKGGRLQSGDRAVFSIQAGRLHVFRGGRRA